MAITMTEKDGSYQEFDTYSEFEQAMVLMSRIGGNKVPQDLLDEVSAKYGDKETKPLQVQIDGSKVEEAIRKATEQLSEALDEATKNRTPESDECAVPENVPKFEVGDKVRVVSAEDGTDSGYHGLTIGSTVEVEKDYGNGKIEAYDGFFYQTLLPHHYEKVEDSPTEFRGDDLVRVTESFRDSFGDVAEVDSILPVDTDETSRVIGVGGVLIGDNADKLQLVCRKEDRKDIDL